MNENLAEITAWKYGAVPNVDFEVLNGLFRRWDVEGVAQPTEAAVMAFEADWLAAGGATARLRAETKDLIDNDRGHVGKALRALASLIRKEVNRLRQNPTTVFAAVTVQQFITAWKDEIDAGAGD